MQTLDEKKESFDRSLNEWLSKEGLTFQLLHARGGGGAFFSHIIYVGIRLFVLALLFLLLAWWMLSKRLTSDSFVKGLEKKTQKELSLKSVSFESPSYDDGFYRLKKCQMQGGQASFFKSLVADGIEVEAGILSAFFTDWHAKNIHVRSLLSLLKAGNSNDAMAKEAYGKLFQSFGNFSFSIAEIDEASFFWGYSQYNSGKLEKTSAHISRFNKGWKIRLQGGTFAQNWLKDLSLEHAVIICLPDSLVFEEVILRKGKGLLRFQGQMSIESQPRLEGSFSINNFVLRDILGKKNPSWLEGSFCAKGTFSGSTNRQEGITTEMDVTLEKGNQLIIRQGFPLFSALKLIDFYHSYRKILFKEGKARVRTGGGHIVISDMNLSSEEGIALTGNLEGRPPSNQEIADTLHIEDEKRVEKVLESKTKFDSEYLSSLFISIQQDNITVAEASRGTEGIDVILQGARDEEGKDPFFDLIIEEKGIERFLGTLHISLDKTLGERLKKIGQQVTFDSDTDRILLTIPVDSVFENAGIDTADTIEHKVKP